MPRAASESSSPSGSATRRGLRPFRRDGEIARCERPGRDVPEHDVRVGDCGLLAAEAVTDGAGHGSRTPWADLEGAGGIEPREAAPTRPDLGDVDGGDPDELAAAPEQSAPGRQLSADLVLLAARHAAALDQRRLRGRASHVERDHVLEPERLRKPERCDDARRGSRLERVDGPDRRVGSGHDAARRLHDLERRCPGDVGDAGADVVEIAGHQRPDVRVHGGRGGALVLLLLAQDLRGERDRHVRNSARSTSPSSRSCSG